MYHALYRKYRPVDFDSVVGQDSIIKTLKNSIINSNFSHAYMFFGPRGTGKTTVSKIFSRNVNCLSPVDGIACRKCSACDFSFSHDCVDIIEIDAASNNGVNEIRELKNNINLVPSELKFKVYIIDEVHMLSDAAFNALLKTLEEPPEHVIFILATTDPQKVPETIISRCQCFSFKRISDNVIEKRLKYVCEQENIDIDDDVLHRIAILSDGGLRDALGSLDKMVSYTNEKITLDEFNEVNGVISDIEISDFITNIMQGNINSLLTEISKFNDSGKNLIQILVQIINYCRDIIVDYYLNSIEPAYSIELLEIFVNNLNEKMFDIKRSGNTKVYIEMFILKFINDQILKISKFNDKISVETFSNEKELNSSKIILNNNDFSRKNENDAQIKDKSIIEDIKNEKKVPVNEKSKEPLMSTDKISISAVSSKNQVPRILNIDQIIDVRVNNTLAGADKNLLKLEINNLELLKEYSFDQNIGYLVNSLLDAKLRAVSSDYLILSYDSDASVSQNLLNIVKLNEVYNSITKSSKKIAIISDDAWEKFKLEYINNLKNNVKYDIQEEPELLFEDLNKNDIMSSSAISLFGEDIVEVE